MNVLFSNGNKRMGPHLPLQPFPLCNKFCNVFVVCLRFNQHALDLILDRLIVTFFDVWDSFRREFTSCCVSATSRTFRRTGHFDDSGLAVWWLLRWPYFVFLNGLVELQVVPEFDLFSHWEIRNERLYHAFLLSGEFAIQSFFLCLSVAFGYNVENMGPWYTCISRLLCFAEQLHQLIFDDG